MTSDRPNNPSNDARKSAATSAGMPPRPLRKPRGYRDESAAIDWRPLLTVEV
jgi:hypothetical protein